MGLVAVEKKAAVRSRGVYARLWMADEFLDWLEEKVYADLIAGQKFMHSPVSLRHADLLNFLERLLAGFIDQKHLGRLHRESVAVQLDQRNVFMPDLCFFTNEQLPRMLPNHVPFAPTLVVEGLSPRTAKRDTGPKFAAYERHGVLEHWILDPINQDHRFYRREDSVFIEYAKDEERISLQVLPEFYFLRRWLSPINQPPPLDGLKEILCGSL